MYNFDISCILIHVIGTEKKIQITIKTLTGHGCCFLNGTKKSHKYLEYLENSMTLVADFGLSSVLVLCRYLGVLLKRKRGKDCSFSGSVLMISILSHLSI